MRKIDVYIYIYIRNSKANRYKHSLNMHQHKLTDCSDSLIRPCHFYNLFVTAPAGIKLSRYKFRCGCICVHRMKSVLAQIRYRIDVIVDAGVSVKDARKTLSFNIFVNSPSRARSSVFEREGLRPAIRGGLFRGDILTKTTRA